jgi:hypothetical protein
MEHNRDKLWESLFGEIVALMRSGLARFIRFFDLHHDVKFFLADGRPKLYGLKGNL